MQLTIRMPDHHYYKMEKLAKQMGLKKSDVARMAIKKYLGDNELREEISPFERTKGLLGAAESGIPDLGPNLRRHLSSRSPAQVLHDLSGCWDDPRSAEQIVCDIKRARKGSKQLENGF